MNFNRRRWIAGTLLFLIVGVLLAWVGFLQLPQATARALLSHLQSGTQVYFDEGRAGGRLYPARVTAFDSGKQIQFGDSEFVLGSTLPDENPTNRYPVVVAASFRFKRGTHYGIVTNEVFGLPSTPALILNPGEGGFAERQGLPVGTVEPNVSPFAGRNFGLRQASQVHVHTGLSTNQRGSVACLTIAPEHARIFFESNIGPEGRIHINRSRASGNPP